MSNDGGLVGRGLKVEKQVEPRGQGGSGMGNLAPVPLKAGHLSICALGEILPLAVPLIWGLTLGEARGTS